MAELGFVLPAVSFQIQPLLDLPPISVTTDYVSSSVLLAIPGAGGADPPTALGDLDIGCQNPGLNVPDPA